MQIIKSMSPQKIEMYAELNYVFILMAVLGQDYRYAIYDMLVIYLWYNYLKFT